MSSKKKIKTNTFLQSKNKKNITSNKQSKNKGKKIGRTKYPWDTSPRNVYSPTKERLEIFLKEVGGKNPFYFESSFDRHLCEQKKSSAYLWLMWMELMGMDNISGSSKDMQNYEPFYWFAELEHLITNDEMFWCLFTDVWCHKSEVISNNPAILSRYGRDKVSLEKRMDCAEHLKIIDDETTSEGSETKSSKTLFLDVVNNLQGNVFDNETIFLYRSFKVEKGKSVRKGVKKLNNPDWHIQEEGKGWSYSVNKANCIFLNGVAGTHHYKKYLNKDDKEALKSLRRQKGSSLQYMDNITHNDNYYNAIGVYSVEKKDIIFLTDEWQEMEVVVNPKNVKLLDYSFLNIYDLLTKEFVFGIIDKEETGRSGILNIDNLYTALRKVMKKSVIDNPKIIFDYLNFKDCSKYYIKLLGDFFESDGCRMRVRTLTDVSDSSKKKYYIGKYNLQEETTDISFV
jgi:hypothetical protein